MYFLLVILSIPPRQKGPEYQRFTAASSEILQQRCLYLDINNDQSTTPCCRAGKSDQCCWRFLIPSGSVGKPPELLHSRLDSTRVSKIKLFLWTPRPGCCTFLRIGILRMYIKWNVALKKSKEAISPGPAVLQRCLFNDRRSVSEGVSIPDIIQTINFCRWDVELLRPVWSPPRSCLFTDLSSC